jgi:hypothetical protein
MEVEPLDPEFAELAAYKVIGLTPEQVAEIVQKIKDGRMVEVVRCME